LELKYKHKIYCITSVREPSFMVRVVTRLRTGWPRNRVWSPAVTTLFLSSKYRSRPWSPTKRQTTEQRALFSWDYNGRNWVRGAVPPFPISS